MHWLREAIGASLPDRHTHHPTRNITTTYDRFTKDNLVWHDPCAYVRAVGGFPVTQTPLSAPDTNPETKYGRSVSLMQAAALLQVSRRTIYNRIRDGQLSTIRIHGSQRVLTSSLFGSNRRMQDTAADTGFNAQF
jgi:excisionase family DNA binding protein